MKLGRLKSFLIVSVSVLALVVVALVVQRCSFRLTPPKPPNQTIERKQIEKGVDSSKIDTLSRRKFQTELDKLSAKNKGLTKLLSELRRQKRKIKTVTKTVVRIQTRVVVKEIKSTSRSGSSHILKIKRKDKLLLATVKFDTRRLKSPWSYELHGMKLRLYILHSVNKKGPDKVGIVAKLVDSKGREYPAGIIENKTKFSYSKTQLPHWKLHVGRPKIELFGTAGSSHDQAFIGLGVSSHLVKLSYRNDVFRFLGVLLSYSSTNNLSLSLLPVSFNLGSTTNLFEDLYLTLGLGLAYSFPKKNIGFSWFVGIGTTL